MAVKADLTQEVREYDNVKDISIGSFLDPRKCRLRKKGTNINHILKVIFTLILHPSFLR